MARQVVRVPEAVLAREIFGPLGAVVEIGAVSATGTWSVGTASVGESVHRRRGEVDRLLELVRGVGGFSSSTMAIADELGYLREHEVTAPSLLLWSGAVEGIPSRLDELERPDVVRRMCHMAADLQLTYFLQALVTAAVAAETEARQGAGRITEALAIATGLADATGRSDPATVFRMWRVAHLPGLLRPEADAPEHGKAGFRAYDRALEVVVAPT
ncbi:hypothetical protein [Streptomyces violaceus]|uniref:Uncharacterized protein n=1 Tax=Streptomyces violaceus TaxID=1936 RepID=A0ABY9U7S7_STRVL|nr:hypothetical protein [Streptomyces janthinus]WND18929.1 hypothetical protein RI060_16960 [Streptomyces janthinus]GGS88519.1 hypothetical protein GCM10010270_70790 [Streptomyces janthinus]